MMVVSYVEQLQRARSTQLFAFSHQQDAVPGEHQHQICFKSSLAQCIPSENQGGNHPHGSRGVNG